jgi:hypothetical protein
MRHIGRKPWYGVVGGLSLTLLLTSSVVAQQTATLDLTGVGSGTVLGGVYTSPYTGTINGGSQTSVICDDFSDESFVPEEWTAYVTSLSTLIAGTDPYTNLLRFHGSQDTTLTQVQGYEAAALLSVDLLDSSGMTREEYSYALWELFDPAAFTTLTTDYGAGNSYETAAASLLSTAESDALNNTYGSGTLTSYLSNFNVTIYSYDPANGTSCGGGYCPGPPQEFITVPEASTPVLLAVDLLGFFALVGFLRKRISLNI